MYAQLRELLHQWRVSQELPLPLSQRLCQCRPQVHGATKVCCNLIMPQDCAELNAFVAYYEVTKRHYDVICYHSYLFRAFTRVDENTFTRWKHLKPCFKLGYRALNKPPRNVPCKGDGGAKKAEDLQPEHPKKVRNRRKNPTCSLKKKKKNRSKYLHLLHLFRLT